VKPERLGRAIGIFGVTQTLGLTLGPLVAGLSEVHLGWRWFFLIIALMSVLPALDFARVFASHRDTGATEAGILALTGRVIGERRVILLSMAGAGLFFAMVGTYTYLATWLKDAQGLAEDRIGVVLALAGAVGIPGSALAGTWVDRVGRHAVGLVGMLAFAGTIVAFGIVPYSFAAFSGLSLLLGWSAATAWTALNTLAVEVLPAFRKPVASVYNAFRFLGYSLAPPVMGLAYGDRNFTAVCVGCALAVVASALFITLLAVARPAR
jgi:DHA1 family chloramphenicol resistance protein-like MFS transporter